VFLFIARISLFYALFYHSVFVDPHNIWTTDGADICLPFHNHVVRSFDDSPDNFTVCFVTHN